MADFDVIALPADFEWKYQCVFVGENDIRCSDDGGRTWYTSSHSNCPLCGYPTIESARTPVDPPPEDSLQNPST